MIDSFFAMAALRFRVSVALVTITDTKLELRAGS